MNDRIFTSDSPFHRAIRRNYATMNKHALYITCETKTGPITFRVGQPVDHNTAADRWTRIANRLDGFEGIKRRPITVRFDGKTYRARTFMAEVRATDAHGRGLGSERHTLAFPVPFRALRSAVR